MSTATTTEAEFQAQVLQLANLCGFLTYHTYDSRRSGPGFPDLVLVHPRRRLTLFRELKRTGGRLSEFQREWITALRISGQDADVWTPEDWPEIERTLRGAT